MTLTGGFGSRQFGDIQMAGLTKEQRAARVAERAAPQTDLIRMTKDDATLDVHPSCVADHERLGWRKE